MIRRLAALATALSLFAQISLAQEDWTRAELDVAAPNAATRAALEEAFFDCLWRVESPVEEKRARAREELVERWREFEPIASDRAFLTNGEISERAAEIFRELENQVCAAVVDEADRALRVEADAIVPNDASDEALGRAVATVFTPKNARAIYLAPDFSRFLRFDEESKTLWRPRALYASPEVAPERDGESVLFEAALERVERPEAPSPDDPRELFSYEALMGLDLRVVAIPVVETAPKTRRSAELSLTDARREKDREQTVLRFKFRYDEPYDAFDSHRAPIRFDDFALGVRRASGEFALIRASRFVERERDARGETIELVFEKDAFEKSLENESELVIFWRTPRFFWRYKKSTNREE